MDDISYLDPESINGLNLYAYCGNNPVMFLDSGGCSPDPIGWFTPSNTFELTATVAQLIFGAAGVSGYLHVAKAIRPNNIGKGIWNIRRAAAIDSFKGDITKLNKASNILAGITVAIQVGEGLFTDINRGYSADRIVSNLVVNTVVYGGSTFALGFVGGKIGAAIGSFIPVPIVGTLIGTAVGFAVGVGFGFLLDWNIGGKSVIDHVRDGVYDFWNWVFG